VTGRDRVQAVERARRALAEFEVTGVRTTLPFLRAVLAEPAFTAEDPAGFTVHTRWIEQEFNPACLEGSGDHADDRVPVRIGGRWLTVAVPGLAQARKGPLARALEQARKQRKRTEQAAGDVIAAPMQGTVVRVAVADGDEVAVGQVLVVVEAMKMENPLRAPHPGRVSGLHATPGDTVAQGAMLCRVVPADAAAPADGQDAA
jgi:acetyl-CoA/propionyl-CoA carboxylase, biotin carboxylase, biotin carboxyl carrier protein